MQIICVKTDLRESASSAGCYSSSEGKQVVLVSATTSLYELQIFQAERSVEHSKCSSTTSSYSRRRRLRDCVMQTLVSCTKQTHAHAHTNGQSHTHAYAHNPHPCPNPPQLHTHHAHDAHTAPTNSLYICTHTHNTHAEAHAPKAKPMPRCPCSCSIPMLMLINPRTLTCPFT